MSTVTQIMSAKKISEEKESVQLSVKTENHVIDMCGHCGKNIIMVPGKNDRWYHYGYSVAFLTKNELVRYCVTSINRTYQSISLKKEQRAKLAAGAKATPKKMMDAEYRERSKTARTRLRIIHDELADL